MQKRLHRHSRRRITVCLVLIAAVVLVLNFALLDVRDNSSEFSHTSTSTQTHTATVPAISGAQDPFFVHGNVDPVSDTISLPHLYPMHLHLPANRSAAAGAIHARQMGSQERCWAAVDRSPLFPVPPPDTARALRPVRAEAEAEAALLRAYQVPRGSSAGLGTFYTGHDAPADSADSATPWWVPGAADSLPCTAEVQRRLHEYQNPQECQTARFLTSTLKDGSHGLGSAFTVLAYDFLSAMILGRVFLVNAPSYKWHFNLDKCVRMGRSGLDCFFLPPSRCPVPPDPPLIVYQGKRAKSTRAHVIQKRTVDIPGLNRDHVPSNDVFFGPGHKEWACYPAYQQWVDDVGNMAVQGGTDKGADSRLFYMLAQVFTYIARAPQPWFQAMLEHHLTPLGLLPPPSPTAPVPRCTLYVQDRGERGKMREYYNIFGCHTVGLSAYVDYVRVLSSSSAPSVRPRPPCSVFVSGGTPRASYRWLREQLGPAHRVLSTWNLSTVVAGAESARWGASSPAASWVDMYAGVASTNWVCIVQSNWCRVIDFLRLTHGRASCGFVDIGALLLTSVKARSEYCVRGDFPTKAFSNVLKRF